MEFDLTVGGTDGRGFTIFFDLTGEDMTRLLQHMGYSPQMIAVAMSDQPDLPEAPRTENSPGPRMMKQVLDLCMQVAKAESKIGDGFQYPPERYAQAIMDAYDRSASKGNKVYLS